MNTNSALTSSVFVRVKKTNKRKRHDLNVWGKRLHNVHRSLNSTCMRFFNLQKANTEDNEHSERNATVSLIKCINSDEERLH